MGCDACRRQSAYCRSTVTLACSAVLLSNLMNMTSGSGVSDPTSSTALISRLDQPIIIVGIWSYGSFVQCLDNAFPLGGKKSFLHGPRSHYYHTTIVTGRVLYTSSCFLFVLIALLNSTQSQHVLLSLNIVITFCSNLCCHCRTFVASFLDISLAGAAANSPSTFVVKGTLK